jgi:multimeric flavodoxin WrbA
LNVLGVVAGPRRNGNTGVLVKTVLEGAKEGGHEVEEIFLGEMDIGPIQALDGKLVYPEDDMVKLYPKIESMEALIFGTPIYYDHVSARAKLFIDRLHYYSRTHGEEYRNKFPDGVKIINIITYAWDNPNGYNQILDWLKGRMEGYWNMDVVGHLKAEGTNKRRVSEREDLLRNSRDLGRSL